eukprot:2593868-Prymnesium_polylepis.2
MGPDCDLSECVRRTGPVVVRVRRGECLFGSLRCCLVQLQAAAATVGDRARVNMLHQHAFKGY